jgi:hypothetical protein
MGGKHGGSKAVNAVRQLSTAVVLMRQASDPLHTFWIAPSTI